MVTLLWIGQVRSGRRGRVPRQVLPEVSKGGLLPSGVFQARRVAEGGESSEAKELPRIHI